MTQSTIMPIMKRTSKYLRQFFFVSLKNSVTCWLSMGKQSDRCVFILQVVSKIHILHFKFNNDMIVILHNCHVAILLTYLWHFQILFKWFILLSHWNRVDPAENQHQVNGTTITTAVHLSRFSVFVVGKSQVPLIPLTIALFYFNDP